jgi:hypothetical protein
MSTVCAPATHKGQCTVPSWRRSVRTTQEHPLWLRGCSHPEYLVCRESTAEPAGIVVKVACLLIATPVSSRQLPIEPRVEIRVVCQLGGLKRDRVKKLQRIRVGFGHEVMRPEEGLGRVAAVPHHPGISSPRRSRQRGSRPRWVGYP